MRWSQEEVRAFVGDARVYGRNARAAVVSIPTWLGPSAEPPAPWDEQVANVHVHDRPLVIGAWWEAVNTPGVPIVVQARARPDGTTWRLLETRYLNLLGRPEVDAILIAQRDLGPTDEPEDPVEEQVASFEAPSWIIQHLDAIGAVLRSDGMVEEVFGRPAETLVGRIMLETLHPDDQNAAIAMWLEVLAAPGATRTIRQRVARTDGPDVWIESTVMNQLEDIGVVLAVSHDISARVHQEAALRASEQAFRTLAEGVPVAVFRTDAAGVLTYANERCAQLLAPQPGLASLIELDPVGPLAAHWAALVDGSRTTLEVDVVCADHRTLRLRCHAVPGREEVVVVGTLDDVSVERAAALELRERAEVDALTGLANRPGFDRRATEVLAGGGGDAAFVFVDLDGFKAVNDTWGHVAGDGVLKEVAARLRAVVRPEDLVARYGGDEFVLLCSGLGPGDEGAVVARIAEALAAPIPVAGAVWQQEASVGVVRTVPGESAASALRRADEQMYARKRGRRPDA